jgi:transposase
MRAEPRSRPSAKRGRPFTGRTPSRESLITLYSKEGKSIRDIGEALKCSKDIVARALKTYGIEARANASRSRLRTIELATLEEGVREKGIRGYARELGVTDGTLRHHLKVRKSPPYNA